MAGNLIISRPQQPVNHTVKLTGSKSESNRALILNALSQGSVVIKNLSEADDTVILKDCLYQLKAGNNGTSAQVLDIGPAGTAMRFLSSYLAVTGSDAILTGSARMKQRPIGILVDALRALGAKISYVENEGYPPLRFHAQAFEQQQEQITVKGDISSQYITSLILVAPGLPQGLAINIEGELTSRPYVEMTLGLLRDSGISHVWEENKITIAPQSFKTSEIVVEPDWSAASYWYAVVALSEKASITLPFLKKNSLQGDSRIAAIMNHFGVTTTYHPEGITISKTSNDITAEFFDLKDCPDLAQTIFVVAAALNKSVSFTGLETLKIKETDRIAALQNELGKIGIVIHEEGENYHLDCSARILPDNIVVKTYEDHRMAMAFAPLCMLLKSVTIEEPAVVGKSYPDFWKDMEHCGFNLKTN